MRGEFAEQIGEHALHAGERHDGAEDAGGPGAAQAAETLQQDHARAGAPGGEGGAEPAGAPADDEDVGLGDDGQFAGGLEIGGG